jgi:hypothetical protein
VPFLKIIFFPKLPRIFNLTLNQDSDLKQKMNQVKVKYLSLQNSESKGWQQIANGQEASG